jgi:membrane protein
MSKISRQLSELPIIRRVVLFLKKIQPKSFEGLSLYNLLEMYGTGIIKGALTYRASAISFSFFMAIFPFLLFVLNLIPYVPIKDFQAQFQSFLESLLPPQTAVFFNPVFEDIANNRRGGFLSSVFILSIFLMANGITAVFGGFETSYHVKITRNIIKQYLVALGVAIIIALLLVLTVAAFIYFEVYILRNLDNYGYLKDETGILIAKFIFLILIIYLVTAILYYFGTTQGKESSFFSPGALLSTILIIITTYLFGIYIENFSTYNEIYGSIGALLILMLYIWLNSNILLLGFELNASIASLKRKS